MSKKSFTVCLLLIVVLMFSVLADASGRQFYQAANQENNSSSTEESTSEAGEESEEESTEAATEESESPVSSVEEPTEEETEEPTEAIPWSWCNPNGMTTLTRFNTPEGYVRADVEPGSFGEYVRTYPLKEHGAPIVLHDGTIWDRQDVHVAVYDLPIEYGDFQQCADAVMRIYAEYFWSIGKTDNIAFYFTTGFLADYASWRDGYRIYLADDQATFYWKHTSGFDDSYETFVQYLRYVFIYASSFSMDVYESYVVDMADLQIGDVFLHGDNPGHVIMVADICYDENGKTAFLLADGHTPAMDFHVLKNPLHEDDPWFYEDEIVYPFETFAHIYVEGELQRLNYLEKFDY